MPNAWVSHVKQYAAANNTSYGCALSMNECKAAYKSKKEPTKTVTKKTKEPTKTVTKKTKESPVPKSETKPYTKYDKPIGPVKPATPVAAPEQKKQEKKPASYYKDMIAMALKDYKEPKLPKSKE